MMRNYVATIMSPANLVYSVHVKCSNIQMVPSAVTDHHMTTGGATERDRFINRSRILGIQELPNG